MDSIKKASSGHMGLPLGCAEIGAVLFGQEMCASPLLARASLLFALHARLANLFQPRSQLPGSAPPLLDGRLTGRRLACAGRTTRTTRSGSTVTASFCRPAMAPC